MKINAKLSERVSELNYVNEINMSLADLFSSIIGVSDLFNKDEIDFLDHQSNDVRNKMMLTRVLETLEIDRDNPEDKDIVDNLIDKHIFEEDIKKYLANPYYQKIKCKNKKYGGYALFNDHYEPFELFSLTDIQVDKKYQEHTYLSYFSQRFDFLALNYDGVTWMSITPNEINTMESSINEAFGKVAVFGLGLGYFPYMISLKENVQEITIIDNNPTIIKLFKENILPLFEHKEKINIIEGDAFGYVNELEDYDYAFIDLWHNPDDGLELFLKFKKIEKRVSRCTFSYWLDKSMIQFLRRCFITLLSEQINGADEECYKNAENIADRIINKYYQATKKLAIFDMNELHSLLNDNELLKLILG